MSRLSSMTYRDVIRVLRSTGFIFDRQAKGSHEIWRNPGTGRYITVPNHPGTMPAATVRAIIRQAGLTVEEFIKTSE